MYSAMWLVLTCVACTAVREGSLGEQVSLTRPCVAVCESARLCLLVTVHKERPPLDISHSLGVERLSADEKEVRPSTD